MHFQSAAIQPTKIKGESTKQSTWTGTWTEIRPSAAALSVVLILLPFLPLLHLQQNKQTDSSKHYPTIENTVLEPSSVLHCYIADINSLSHSDTSNFYNSLRKLLLSLIARRLLVGPSINVVQTDENRCSETVAL